MSARGTCIDVLVRGARYVAVFECYRTPNAKLIFSYNCQCSERTDIREYGFGHRSHSTKEKMESQCMSLASKPTIIRYELAQIDTNNAPLMAVELPPLAKYHVHCAGDRCIITTSKCLLMQPAEKSAVRGLASADVESRLRYFHFSMPE